MNSSIVSRRHWRQRGAASVEAILVLFFLIFIWTGVEYFSKLTKLSLSTRAQARRCALQMAIDGCEVVPEDCSGQKSDEDSSSDDKIEALSELSDEKESSIFTDAVMDLVGMALGENFFDRADVSVPAQVPAPAYLGGETTELNQGLNFPCNPTHESIDSKIQDVFEDVFGKALGSLIGGKDDREE